MHSEHSVLDGVRSFKTEKNEKLLQATQQLTDGKFTSRAGIYWERAEYSMIPMNGMQCSELMLLTRLDQL